jgi:penicillin-binding protein 1C
MPEERDLPEEFDSEEEYDDDHDVPFKLPKANQDETEDIDPVKLGPTMPSSGSTVPHDKRTLPGSGGFDPNPDFAPRSEAAKTIRNQPVRISQETVPAPTSQQQPAYPQYQRPTQPTMQEYIPPMPPAQTNNVPQSGSRPLPRKRRTSPRIFGLPRGCLWIFLGTLATFCGGLTCLTTVLFGVAYSRVDSLVQERIAKVDDYRNFQSSFIYDRSGTQLYEVFGEGRRTNVSFDQFPEDLINATIAIEDDSFWTNIGIDVPATTIAVMQYLGTSSGQDTAGGSTITQQLVRNVLFDPEYRAERSVQRKVEEILLALAITQRKSKQEIIEMYLNEIYYGNLAYGAEAAARVFFNKSVSQLTLGEAALLAGLPQAPADLDPMNPDPAVQERVYLRWRQVLDEMVEEDFITDAQRNQALNQGLNFVPPQVSLLAPHFTVYAQGELERLMTQLGYTPEEISKGGLQVYTTIDLNINEMVQQAVRQQVAALAAKNVTNGAAIVIKPVTGEIMAMVGSVDYNNDAVDGRVNVTIALRQPGSTMKPFTYSAAMELGMTPGDVIWDTLTEIPIPGQEPYRPVNYDGTFHGPMRMRVALANSINIAAVQTLRRVGVEYLLSLMQRFGVETMGTDASRYGLSLTLGGGEISLVELTQAYAVFANQGALVNVTSILCVLDNEDNIIYEYEDGCPKGNPTDKTVTRLAFGKTVLDPRIAFIISDMLADNNARALAIGTNSPLRTDGIASSAKTGTTNDFKDNWTVGFTRNVAVGVWVGNSNGDPMRGVSGLDGAAPIWKSVMTGIYGNPGLLGVFGQLVADQIAPPGGMTLRRMCDVRALSEGSTTCNASQAEWFLDGPAGIPDPDGNLNFPSGQPQGQGQPASGPWIQEYEPGIFRVLAQPIPAQIAAAIQFNVPPGQKVPPPPRYCQVPVEIAANAPGAQNLLFLAPPPFAEDAAEAERYAQTRGLAYLPTVACTPELLTAQSFGPQVVTAVITSPAPYQTITDLTAIVGTVQFTGEQVQFYKLEIIGGKWQGWVTIGNVHNEVKVNDVLEYLPGPSPDMIPGDYQLRLVLVDWNGGIVQDPYIVPFKIQ